jgi:hypothetical protein
MTDSIDLTYHQDGQPQHVATLTQRWLGATPYVVIELGEASDGSGEPAVFLEPGAGAEEEPLTLPLLALTGTDPTGNPIAEMLRTVWNENDNPAHRVATQTITAHFQPDWLDFVTTKHP